MKEENIPQSPTPSPQPLPLTRIVPQSHELVCEVLEQGDLAIDLTAGKGRDTLVLAHAVGPAGCVISFDVQSSALEQTAALLKAEGFSTRSLSDEQVLPRSTGVYLVEKCHSRVADVVHRPVKAIIANLGYLPGGDQTMITRPESTLVALEQSLGLLTPGGRLAVTVYPSHPGGDQEARQVDDFFENLSRQKWQVLLVRAANRPEAPYLYAAESLI